MAVPTVSEQIITLTAPPDIPVIVASDTFGCGEARVKFSLDNVDTDTISYHQLGFRERNNQRSG